MWMKPEGWSRARETHFNLGIPSGSQRSCDSNIRAGHLWGNCAVCMLTSYRLSVINKSDRHDIALDAPSSAHDATRAKGMQRKNIRPRRAYGKSSHLTSQRQPREMQPETRHRHAHVDACLLRPHATLPICHSTRSRSDISSQMHGRPASCKAPHLAPQRTLN